MIAQAHIQPAQQPCVYSLANVYKHRDNATVFHEETISMELYVVHIIMVVN